MNKTLLLLLLPLTLLGQTITVVQDVDKVELIQLMLQGGHWAVTDSNALPHSILKYHTAAGKSQNAHISHQQDLGVFMNIGLELEKYAQEGVFNKEDAKYYDFKTRFFFQNKKQNYFLSNVLTYQKYTFTENAGIVHYEKELYDDLMLYPVHLASATNSGRHRGLALQQEFLLNDEWRVRHQWSRWRKSKKYTDDAPLAGFYNTIYLDSIQTVDSTFIEENKHTVGVLKQEAWELSYLLQSESYFDQGIDTSRVFHGLDLAVQTPFVGGELMLKGQLLTQEQYAFQAYFARSKKLSYKIEFLLEQENSPLQFQQFTSNHFRWDNQFNPTQYQSLFLQVSYGIFSFESRLNRNQNYCYWDEQALIQQWKIPLYHLKSTLHLDWQWKKWVGKQQLNYQLASDSEIQPLPTWYAQSTLYYESPFFEDAMTARLGVDLDYFTAYYAMAYMPALGQMHLQKEVKIGDYPLLTAFVETQIQSATIRLQARNLSDLLLENPHFVLPGYPYPPMAIEFGVRWGLN